MAAECFYDHGVAGIDTVTATARVAKMSPYNDFAGKDDLVLAYLVARHEEWLDLYRVRRASASDARQRVAAVFDAYADHAETTSRNGFRGCGLLSFLLEGAMARAGLEEHPGRLHRVRELALRLVDAAAADAT